MLGISLPSQFEYRNGVLHVEGVSALKIARECGTPVYVYSTTAIAERFAGLEAGLSEVDHLICYALKANSNQSILKLLNGLGAGFDAVSGGEYARAIAAGAPGQKIVFSGVGKTESEMRSALEGGIRQFNVESEPELLLLNGLAASMDAKAPVAIRINPDIDAETHQKISTGMAENKFGVPIRRARHIYSRAAELPNIDIVGIDVHIGSQLQNLEPFRKAFSLIAELAAELRADGHAIKRIDLGGGLGIAYNSREETPICPEDYCEAIIETVGHLGCEIEIEPGRYIVGDAGILLSNVLYLKDGADRRFLVVDAAMNDLMRPAIYDAYHEIIPVSEPGPDQSPLSVDVVGPVCESSDTFAKQRLLPAIGAGDTVAFLSAGSYGSSMASEYNTRALVPEVLVNGEKHAVIRKRPTIKEIIDRDIVPAWL
ncbi:MAG: diaminopimelate decarboxylase [Albidovulum sp.]|nr:diaminopimelate decarboxylase [Albidovulum sp.]